MHTFIRLAAAALLAILLPIQAGAAACAQICTLVHAEHQPAAVDHAHAHGSPATPAHDHSDHCSGSDMGCCQGQTLMAGAELRASSLAIPSFERGHFVERWTSFFPDEPSPPPIA